MGDVTILGAGFAIPEEDHENTHLFFLQGEHGVLVDCASNPIIHLRKSGISFDSVTDLILTHFHPDHVSGVPLFLMGLWLLGRRKSLHVYGLDYTIDRVEALMGLFDWKKWPNFFPVFFHRIPEMEHSLVIGSDDLRVTASPVKHLIPTIGIRVEFTIDNRSFAYSCDTEPCREMVALAQGVDLLIHESTGLSLGHSSPSQAAHIAVQAGAARLMLIHYSKSKRDTILAEAQTVFPGRVSLAHDFLNVKF